MEAQAEETRFREEAEQAREEEKQQVQKETKLAAALARIEQLKAQKLERETRWSAMVPATPLTIERPQSQTTVGFTLTTEGAQSQATIGSAMQQGESSLVSVKLFEQYPAIDKAHLKAIKENTFKPINVVKLTTNMILDRSKVKILAVRSNVALKAQEEDAALGELKGLSHLICCFLIYMNILLHFTQNSLEKPLRIRMLAYVEQL